jgi:hypothetical protein
MLKQCSDELTRENVMKQAANLQHLERYVPFGPILTGAVG